MTIQWLYEAGLQATYEDITDRVRLYFPDLTQKAEEGSPGISTITIDDPDGDYEVKGFRRIAGYETSAAAGSNALAFNGFITGRSIVRGPYLTSAGRQWVCQVVDTNFLLELRVLNGNDANRPAETDVARVLWVMGTNEMGRIPNHDFLATTSPVPMDAVDYRGQRAVDVLNDCSQASGKNYFAFCTDGTPAPLPAAPGITRFWYGFEDSTAYTSSIRLSNDLADVENDPYGLTYAIADDTDLDRSPDRVYSGAYGQYDGGTVYEEDIATSNEFTRRDAVIPMENVKSNAKATARALRYLSEMDTEEDRITTAVRLPTARLNWLREGMRCQFRATHLPGYDGPFSYLRVLRRSFLQDSEDEYLVTLELGTGPSSPAVESQPAAGPANVYFDGDNDIEVWINGTFIGDNSTNHKTLPISVGGGIVVAGDNVLAIRITNGVEPARWDLGNVTYLEARLYPAGGGSAYVSTGATVRTWDVSNTPSGTLGGTPANWNTAAFDDSGWSDALDVTDDAYITAEPPISPARYVAPPLAPSGTYARGLVWLARMNFIAT